MKNGAEKKIHRAMTVAYPVGAGLYINLTNKCSNRCEFCIRNNGDGAYGSDSLWLEHEPCEKEVMDAVLSFDLSEFSEVVFCGYGEPSCRLDLAVSVAKKIKAAYPSVKTRINTNGQSDLILGYNTAPMYRGAFDTVSISLNAPSREKYQSICHSVYGCEAFDAILRFAGNVKCEVECTVFSVVKESMSDCELEECRNLACSLGIPLRVREYIGPDN